jgi:hypothetical protein
MTKPNAKTLMLIGAVAVAALIAWLTFRSRRAFAADGVSIDPLAPPSSPFAGLSGGGWSGGGGGGSSGFAGAGTFSSLPVTPAQAAPEIAGAVLAESKAAAAAAVQAEGVKLGAAQGVNLGDPFPVKQKHGKGYKAKGAPMRKDLPSTLPPWIPPPAIVGDGADSERQIAGLERSVTANNAAVLKTVANLRANPKPKTHTGGKSPYSFASRPLTPAELRANAAKAKAKAVKASAPPPSFVPPTGGGPIQVVSHAPRAVYKGNDPKAAEASVTRGAGAF